MSTATSAAAAALVGNSKDLVGEILSRLPLSSVMRFRLGDQLLLHYHSDRFNEELVLYSLNHEVDIKKIDFTDKKKKIYYKRQPPSTSVGNMVVLTPSLASFQHNYNRSAAALPSPGNDTFFSLSTKYQQ